ncbi:hypothetical protein [Nocardia sp. NPDC052566]|uniref:hypothetical protein n=1 Tax=Nocardia sp. NPDC052566 TaxID=3364330 RepID=UPI0037C7D3C5
MAESQLHDLPDTDLAVLRRRADAAGRALDEQIRHELIALSRRRVPVDAVVEFLMGQGRDLDPDLDIDGVALVQLSDLPADAVLVLCRRARAEGVPLAGYVRAQLRALVRRRTLEDDMLEFRAAADEDPTLELDMRAIAEAIRYARGA